MIQEIKFPTTAQALIQHQEDVTGRVLRSDERDLMDKVVDIINDAYTDAASGMEDNGLLIMETELSKFVKDGIIQEPIPLFIRQWVELFVWWINLAWMIGGKAAHNGRT